MALYAIGDVQGCYRCLNHLLDKIHFDSAHDRLWFTGDLVNRGRHSADVVRLVSSFGDRAVAVLGNHDLHLLAIAAGVRKTSSRDTLKDILHAPDSERLLTWISARPLFHQEADIGYCLVHAGLLPQWNIGDAARLAREAEAAISGQHAPEFFRNMYGDMPNTWTEELTGWDRLRLIVNGFTRVRFCDASGRMDFQHKDAPTIPTAGLVPWFQVPWRRSRGERIVFGHWSLLGLWNRDGVICLDTGCVWGRQLSAVRLNPDPPEFFSVQCKDCGNPRI